MIFQLRTPEPSEIVSVESIVFLVERSLIFVHNLHCFGQIKMVSFRTLKYVTLTPRFDRESFLSVFSLVAVVRIGFTKSCILLLGVSAGC